MLQDISVVAMAAIGTTIIIIAGGIDLSAGSTIAFAMITCAYVLNLGPHSHPSSWCCTRRSCPMLAVTRGGDGGRWESGCSTAWW